MAVRTFCIIAILLLSFFSFTDGHADTNVGGNITQNTTWTLSGSPYIVTSTVQVLQGVKLTIEPGVEIKFEPYTDFNVGGELNAIGTQSQRIIFKQKTLSYYNTILMFTSTCVGAEFDSELTYESGCIIQFCKFQAPINIRSDVPLYINNNELTGITYTSIKLNSSDSSVVKNNKFVGYSRDQSIAIDAKSKSFIQDNVIDYLRNGVIGHSKNFIKSNIIKNCKTAIKTSLENAITYNRITKCGYSLDPGPIIVLSGDNTVFRNNTVVGNLVNPNNYEMYDYWAIQISGNAYGMVIEYNDIFDNYCDYEIKNQSTDDIDAKYNYWGTTDDASINSKIYDYFDNINYGKVNYIPFATEPYEWSKCYVSSDGICGGKEPCYETIEEAINASNTDFSILVADGDYDGSFTLNENKSLTLQGGWDASFKVQNGTTTLKGAPKAEQGSLTMQNLNIIPN